MKNKYYLRFWDNKKQNKSVIVGFISMKSADKFVNTYQNFGGIRNFEVDYWGESFEENKCDTRKPYLHGMNNAKTAVIVDNALGK